MTCIFHYITFSGKLQNAWVFQRSNRMFPHEAVRALPPNNTAVLWTPLSFSLALVKKNTPMKVGCRGKREDERKGKNYLPIPLSFS